ncbi:energy-coupling factor transport system permease protein [Sanguibacter gelidistatuariae]|uniref:Energy-coupling factor transport system permease protein n=1 Tax=Sanguibacter gelidistatuariae TaxID=1814289 RepID=A0A1G6REQ7_9MICO|nr:hypothetical protein [Sanguibacter gelidistatuariae]SDD03122.1 energy-coupling factor transport system permease protein [Sanguibacter gelidistatuariae]
MTVHPAAWWIWALVVAGVATATTNVLVLALAVVAICLVVVCCAQDAAPFRLYLVVAAAVVVIRMAFRLVFPATGGTALLTLPTVQLGPLDLFGTLTTEALVSGLAGGLQLAVVILAVGAAHTLADVLDLLKHAPPALAGLSTSLVIAVSVFPGLGRSVVDVRRAARLRGGRRTGLRGLRATVIPVLEGTMDRSLTLAAAMEARGYGSRVTVPRPSDADSRGAAGGPAGSRRSRGWAQPACVLGAVTCVALAAYGLFDSAWPGWAPVALTAAAVAAMVAATRLDRTARRTVYRPQRWTAPSSLVVASAVVSAGMLVLGVPPQIRHPPPVLLPDLTMIALLAPLVAALPAALPALSALLIRRRRS